ncbi:type II secretion system inner membrane protein GspF [Jeongeupia naejangsanensis]|uniref:Type II secretion system inner membrane protein GspF n=1 Tax=Jeongeupia naejangsanensis TaxID=613195 RepID=A0ABS2BIM7_9NEIS|nr:type II secretion system inner membrane protein GspF [Jeongeupia naejangsanensis]MBM3114816.1 type II secretion system inner membrane protein GspF [Jeongeupia naejangsanensis]
MSAFRYRAVDADGKEVRGGIEADNARSVRMQLRERGLWVSELHEGAMPGAGRRPRGLGTARLALLTRQLSTLLDAGLTIDEALVVLGEQSDGEREKTLVAAIRSEILAGVSLSQALASHPAAFPELYRTIVAAGEESGKAAAVMQRLADYLESRAALASKVMLAFIYPLVVMVVSALVIIGLLTWVVPQMVTVFQSAKQTLPFLTRALLWVSALVRDWGAVLLVVLVLAGLGVWRALKQPGVRRAFDLWVLRLPLFGRFERAGNTARLASTLAILVGSGVPLLRAMNAAAGVIGSLPLRDAVQTAAAQVREGMTLSRALAESKLFPPVLIHLIGSGEATGRLEHMLDKAAQQQSQELENRVATFTSLLGPVMVLLMGGVVLLIVLAILLPVFEMNQLVK